MVLGRFETYQGLLCNLSGVPGAYEKQMVFMAVGRRGPPEGSFWPFLLPPVRSWRDPEACLPYLRDFHGFRALRTAWFPRCNLPGAPLQVSGGPPEHMKNTWFSRCWDAGGPPDGSFWAFCGPRLVPGGSLKLFYHVKRFRTATLRVQAEPLRKKGFGSTFKEHSYRKYRAPRARVPACHSQGGRRSGLETDSDVQDVNVQEADMLCN